MHQSQVTIALDIKPRSVDAALAIMQDLKNNVEHPASEISAYDPYSQIDGAIPGLYIGSIMVDAVALAQTRKSAARARRGGSIAEAGRFRGSAYRGVQLGD
jgi:hypothetical protein